MSAKWLQIRNAAKDTDPIELLIYAEIGKDWFSNEGTSAKEFADTLSEIAKDREIIVGINSPGGNVWDGLAIYHQLQNRKDKVTTRIDGVAASIASVIAMAGKQTVMPENALMMIHDPWGMAVGNADEMRKMASDLDAHKEVLVGIYADKTKRNRADISKAMSAETWLNGREAKEQGYADSVLAPVDIQSSFNFSRFKNAPAALRAANGLAQPTLAANPAQPAAAQISPPDLTTAADGVRGDAAQPQPKGSDMSDKTNTVPAAPPQPAEPNPPPVLDLKPLLDEIKAMREAFTKSPEPPKPTDPVPPRPHVTLEGVMDRVNAQPRGRKRMEFMRDNWSELRQSQQAEILRAPRGANTDTAAGVLTTAMLSEAFYTVLQNRCAPLRAFTRDFGTDRMKPKAVVVVPKVVAGGTAQSNATSFEDTTNFVGEMDDVSITVAQITAGGHITNAELQNGWRMAWWAEVKSAEFADKIMSLAVAPITTTNFATHDPVTSAAAAFGWDELKTLWGNLEKSTVKNIILDGPYFARFLPETREDWDASSARMPGWDGFYLNTSWTGAGTNTTGFACNPQAICVASGLPLLPDSASRSGLRETVVTLDGIGLSVAIYNWFALAGRVDWMTIDCCFGAALGDGTAGVVIKSA